MYQRQQIGLLVIVFCGIIQWTSAGVLVGRNDKQLKLPAQQTPLDPKLVAEVLREYRKLSKTRTRDEMQDIATIGLIKGTLKTEKQMMENLNRLTKDFINNFDKSTVNENMVKLANIEKAMEHDRRSIEALVNALDLAKHSKSLDEYKKEMRRITREDKQQVFDFAHKKSKLLASNGSEKVGKLIEKQENLKNDLTDTIKRVKSEIDSHLSQLHATVSKKTKETIKYLEGKKAIQSGKLVNAKSIENSQPTKREDDQIKDRIARITAPLEKLTENEIDNGEDTLECIPNCGRNQGDSGDGNNSVFNERTDNPLGDGKQNIGESDSDSAEGGDGGGGGLLGLIAGLSGGEDGSDVGALLGAVSGIITNLFGPESGLDVNSIISTATSVLATLLAGDENFGTVLGTYIGTAVEGFSGGGGAINNGQFFGNFLGTLVASLSADPEEEGGPKPLLFFQNFLSSFKSSKNKGASGEEGDGGAADGGSDSFGFIKNIFSSIVGGITNAVLGSSLGSSGGSSQGSSAGSHSASAGSSASSSPQVEAENVEVFHTDAH